MNHEETLVVWQTRVGALIRAKMPETTLDAELKALGEEVVELALAYKQQHYRSNPANWVALVEEAGDLLGVFLTVCHLLGVNAEQALREYITKIATSEFEYLGSGRYRRIKPHE